MFLAINENLGGLLVNVRVRSTIGNEGEVHILPIIENIGLAMRQQQTFRFGRHTLEVIL